MLEREQQLQAQMRAKVQAESEARTQAGLQQLRIELDAKTRQHLEDERSAHEAREQEQLAELQTQFAAPLEQRREQSIKDMEFQTRSRQNNALQEQGQEQQR